VDTSSKNAISHMVAAGYQQLHMLIPNIIMRLYQDYWREPHMNSACPQKIFRVAPSHWLPIDLLLPKINSVST